MMHDKRRWAIFDVDSLEEAARKLYKQTWVCCNALRYKDLLLLNDATSENGAQEYAVVRLDEQFAAKPVAAGQTLVGRQIESLTVSWYESEAALLSTLQKLARGKLACEGPDVDGLSMNSLVQVRTHPSNETCGHCA